MTNKSANTGNDADNVKADDGDDVSVDGGGATLAFSVIGSK